MHNIFKNPYETFPCRGRYYSLIPSGSPHWNGKLPSTGLFKHGIPCKALFIYPLSLEPSSTRVAWKVPSRRAAAGLTGAPSTWRAEGFQTACQESFWGYFRRHPNGRPVDKVDWVDWKAFSIHYTSSSYRVRANLIYSYQPARIKHSSHPNAF